MTILELISSWSEEERGLHAQLVLECLERERSLIERHRKIRISEEDLKKGLDSLLSELNHLAQNVTERSSRMENTYLLLIKGEGNT